MTVQTRNSNVALFPLCDKSGVMLQALTPVCPNSNDSRARRPGTRPDAIVFAWVLDLPTGIDSVDAARAVLDVTRPHWSLLTPHQRSVVTELAKLIEREMDTRRSTRRGGKQNRFTHIRQGRKRLFSRHNRTEPSVEERRFVCLSGGLEQRDDS